MDQLLAEFEARRHAVGATTLSPMVTSSTMSVAEDPGKDAWEEDGAAGLLALGSAAAGWALAAMLLVLWLVTCFKLQRVSRRVKDQESTTQEMSYLPVVRRPDDSLPTLPLEPLESPVEAEEDSLASSTPNSYFSTLHELVNESESDQIQR